MLRYLLFVPLLAAPALLLGCPGEDASPNTTDSGADGGVDAAFDATEPCDAGFLGDPTKDPDIEIRALTAAGTDVPVNAGDDLAIVLPPQGGRVVFVGVRAINVDACGIQVTSALRDPNTQQIRTDGRTLNLQLEADGWGTSGNGTTVSFETSDLISNYSNVPVCPNEWASTDVFDNPFQLEVLVQDRRGRQTSKTVQVVPRCAESGEKLTECQCLCKHGYVLGESCGDVATDGGTL